MAARLKCLGKQYHSRDILEHLKRELQHTIKLQHCTNVLELASDGIKYQLSLAPKTARAVTFDRRDYLTDEEIAQLQQNPTTAALPSLNDMQTLLQQTHSSKAVASIFEDYYQVYMLQYSCWVKVQTSTGFATAMQPTKFNGLDSVNFCKTSIDSTSMKK